MTTLIKDTTATILFSEGLYSLQEYETARDDIRMFEYRIGRVLVATAQCSGKWFFLLTIGNERPRSSYFSTIEQLRGFITAQLVA